MRPHWYDRAIPKRVVQAIIALLVIGVATYYILDGMNPLLAVVVAVLLVGWYCLEWWLTSTTVNQPDDPARK